MKIKWLHILTSWDTHSKPEIIVNDMLFTKDKIVATIIDRLEERSEAGMKTYGMTMAENPLTTIEWIDHAIEEALDFACYLERIKKDLKKDGNI